MRVTQTRLRNRIASVNALLGYGEEPTYPTPGAYVLYGAYGGWDVHRICNASGGQESLLGGYGPARECDLYLSGVIATLRAVGVDARSDDSAQRRAAKRARDLHASHWRY